MRQPKIFISTMMTWSETRGIPEASVHRAWEALAFDREHLQTIESDLVEVLFPGILNHSDGPDFQNAIVRIGNLQLHGDVEIHINARDWNGHGHQHDSNYNGVVLHVVLSTDGRPCFRLDGQAIPTLILRPHPGFFNPNTSKSLACQALLDDGKVSDSAIEMQVNRAKMAYFERRIQVFVDKWPTSQPMSRAWVLSVGACFGDLLGIPQNREAARLWAVHFITHCFHETGEEPNVRLRFKSKGVRVKARFANRQPQLEFLLKRLVCIEPRHVISNPKILWDRLIFGSGLSGFNAKLLYQLAWIPGIWVLGSMLSSASLMDEALAMWQASEHPLAPPLKAAAAPLKARCGSLDSTGLSYQIKYECWEKRCLACQIFKDAQSA